MTDCVFCAIVAGELRSWPVYEDDETVAFLNIAQVTPGHTLVVPRRHAADLWTLTETEAALVARSVHHVAHLLRDRLRPLGMNVTQSNGAAAWQEVFHYHVHLIPRYGDDSFEPPWREKDFDARELSEVHSRIVR